MAVLADLNPGTAEWLVIAFWAAGTSYITFLVLALRITATRRLSKLFPYAAILPWLVLLPPAIPLAFVGDPEVSGGAYQLIWLVPGYAGYVAGPLVHGDRLGEDAVGVEANGATAHVRCMAFELAQHTFAQAASTVTGGI